MPDLTLASINIRRRTAAIALFRRAHLEDMLVRELSNDPKKAENSIAGFLRQTLERYRIELVAMGSAQDQSARVQQLYDQARVVLRSENMPLQEVSTEDIFQSFAMPPVRHQNQLRKIGQTIWPALNNRKLGHAGIDAAAVGLYVQTERLFTLNSPQA